MADVRAPSSDREPWKFLRPRTTSRICRSACPLSRGIRASDRNRSKRDHTRSMWSRAMGGLPPLDSLALREVIARWIASTKIPFTFPMSQFLGSALAAVPGTFPSRDPCAPGPPPRGLFDPSARRGRPCCPSPSHPQSPSTAAVRPTTFCTAWFDRVRSLKAGRLVVGFGRRATGYG